MKFFLEYIKSKISKIVLLLSCFLIFFVVIALYRINIDAVLYAFCLCLLVLIPYFFYQYYKSLKAFNKLKLLLKEEKVIIQKDSLPYTVDLLDLQYQNVINRVETEKQEIESDYDGKREDISDYYTLWAHQIKTPIFAMSLLLKDNSRDNKSECANELVKIEQYVEMVLGYIRIQSNENDFVIKCYSIDSIIKTSIKKFSKQFILKKISLNYIETDLEVITDKKWLGFALDQIISNALKYTKSGSVSIYCEDKKIYIKDTGIGISPEDIPRICERGYTGYNGRIDSKSTGLGLYLCHRILEKLGHTLRIESELNVGTKVIINLDRPDLKIE